MDRGSLEGFWVMWRSVGELELQVLLRRGKLWFSLVHRASLSSSCLHRCGGWMRKEMDRFCSMGHT